MYPQSPPTHKYVLPLAREEGGGTHTTPGLLGMLQAAQVPRTRQRALQAAAWLRIWRSARTARAIPRLSACATAHCGQLYGRHVMVGMLKPCVRVKSCETERWRELHLVWAKRSFGKRVKFFRKHRGTRAHSTLHSGPRQHILQRLCTQARRVLATRAVELRREPSGGSVKPLIIRSS